MRQGMEIVSRTKDEMLQVTAQVCEEICSHRHELLRLLLLSPESSSHGCSQPGMEQESMKWVAGIRFLVWSMLTWVQPVGECALSPSDAASLCYIFTVGKSGSGPWWHKVQGQLNEETFINCDSNNNCHATGLLGNRLMVTKLWKTQAEPLKDGIHLLKAELIDMTNKTRGTEPLTLQARMCCCYEDGHFDGFWNIGLNGHKILHFDLSTGKLTKAAEGSKKRLTSSDVTDFFYMTSHGDCRSWLKEFKSHWEEKLEPIASPNGMPVVNQLPLSLAIKPNISVLLIFITCSLLLLM